VTPSHPMSPLQPAPEPVRARGRARRSGWETFRIVVLSAAALYFLVPLLWLLIASTKSVGELFSSPALLLSEPQLLENIQRLLTYDGGIYVRWAGNSMLYAFGASMVGTLFAALAGYFLAMFRFRGSSLLFNTVLGAVLVPSTALALPLFLLFSQIGQTNTVWSVLLPSIVAPIGLFLCRIATTAAVPVEMVEAARLDGAGEFRIFFTLATRLLAPALVTVFLLQFVGVWNNFLLPVLMLHDQSLYPITLGLYAWDGQKYLIPDLQSLVLIGSLISVIPVILLFVALQRFWRSGLAAGTVKG
jgi:multiple sugar transport system permease protein